MLTTFVLPHSKRVLAFVFAWAALPFLYYACWRFSARHIELHYGIEGSSGTTVALAAVLGVAVTCLFQLMYLTHIEDAEHVVWARTRRGMNFDLDSGSQRYSGQRVSDLAAAELEKLAQELERAAEAVIAPKVQGVRVHV